MHQGTADLSLFPHEASSFALFAFRDTSFEGFNDTLIDDCVTSDVETVKLSMLELQL